jgi:head-tail adaptor
MPDPRPRIGAKRYQVDVCLPAAGALDSLGQRKGSPTTLYASVPAAIEQLTGLELVRAQRICASASYRVTITACQNHGITSRHYLLWGTRRLHVGAVIDTDGTGLELQLLCGEEV